MQKFLVTAELARLARWLRVLGFDAALANSNKISCLNRMCNHQHRILLTRMHKNSKLRFIRKIVTITSDAYQEQIRQVVAELNLKEFVLFSRCIYCNRAVYPISKAAVNNRLPEKVRIREEQFTHCRKCGRIYWKGDHYQAMLQFLQPLISGLDEAAPA